MLQSVKWISDKIQEFMGRIDALEDKEKETEGEVNHLKRELELLRRETQHHEHVNEKVHEYQGQKIVELEQRLTKVEVEKKNALREKKNRAISATIAKKQLAKLKEELKGPPKDPKKRH